MFDMAEMRDELARWVAELEPRLYAGPDACALLGTISDIKRLAGAAEMLLAKQVAETDAWRGNGDRSAAHWFAKRAGISVGEAKATLETADKLADLPRTAEAFRAGKLSGQQARAVAGGATADPLAEDELLDLAARESLKELKDQSRRAQAVDDEDGRQRSAHEKRSLRHWQDPDGTFRISYAGTTEAGARIVSALKPLRDRAMRAAHREGRSEPIEAHAADALLAMAETATGSEGRRAGPNAKVIVVVDAEALRRGFVEHGEICEIRGVGPVPVDTARRLLGDAALAVVIKDGVDIKNVTHLRRKTNAHQRTALEYLGVRCDIEGCDSTDFVDIHHVTEWVRTHHTRLDELEASCKYHHRLKHKGWQKRAGSGRQPLLPPAHPELEANLDGRSPPEQKKAA